MGKWPTVTTKSDVRRVYEESYLRIMLASQRIPLELDEFQTCTAKLRSYSHGSILVNRQAAGLHFKNASCADVSA